MKWLTLTSLFLAGLMQGCGQQPRTGGPESPALATATPAAPSFQARVAPERLAARFREVMSHAPRPVGSPALDRFRGYLKQTLAGFRLTVREEPFQAGTPAGQIAMANIIAEKPGTSRRIVYLASHIDTKIFSGIEFTGANDSGSSTATLIELAETLSALPLRDTIRFAFFDGEEAMRESISRGDGLYGSYHHAGRLARSEDALRVRALILLDMMGDIQLDLTRDRNSDPGLYARFAACCRQLGHGDILSENQNTLLDDHIPFREMNIPVLDIIDFNYGPDNSWWHTANDIPAHVSVPNMVKVADAVLCLLADLDRENR